MTNNVGYDATAHDIRAVVVYQVNRAEVSRRIQVDLKVRLMYSSATLRSQCGKRPVTVKADACVRRLARTTWW